MCCIEISCRDFKLAAGLDSVSFIASNVGPDDVAVSNESINVICGNLRVIKPLSEKLMMSGRRGDRIGEMISLEGSEAIKHTRGFLAGLDVFHVEFEEVKYRRTSSNRGALKHASKGWEASRTGS